MKNRCPRCQEEHNESFLEFPNPIYYADLESFYTIEPGMFSPAPARLEIAKLLKCPVDWEKTVPGHAIAFSLEKFWREVASNCLHKGSGDLSALEKTKDEAEYNSTLDEIVGEAFDEYFLPPFLESESERQLMDDLPAIRQWIERAKESYIQQTRRFRDMRFATEDIYRRHFPLKQFSTEIRVKTDQGKRDSLFYHGVTPARLEDVMWMVFDDYWRRLLHVQQASLYVDALTVIGASRGKDTRWIHFDVDLSTPQTHAYPIGESEIPRDEARTVRIIYKATLNSDTWRRSHNVERS